jgi:hypothetical protein
MVLGVEVELEEGIILELDKLSEDVVEDEDGD